MKDSLLEEDIRQIKISFEKYLEINDRKQNLKDEEKAVKEEVKNVVTTSEQRRQKLYSDTQDVPNEKQFVSFQL